MTPAKMTVAAAVSHRIRVLPIMKSAFRRLIQLATKDVKAADAMIATQYIIIFGPNTSFWFPI